MTKRLYRNCKRGHDLSDALIWGALRYCRKCKRERSAYDWYRVKCKKSGITENVATWEEWALEKMGPPVKRERVEC